jgi:hypothetical protein
VSNIESGKMDLTLVAYYGEKSSEFSDLIEAVQKKIRESLPPDTFCAYQPQQVHATIIGLEGRRVGGHVINTTYVERRHELRAINFSRVFHILFRSTSAATKMGKRIRSRVAVCIHTCVVFRFRVKLPWSWVGRAKAIVIRIHLMNFAVHSSPPTSCTNIMLRRTTSITTSFLRSGELLKNV